MRKSLAMIRVACGVVVTLVASLMSVRGQTFPSRPRSLDVRSQGNSVVKLADWEALGVAFPNE